MCWGRNDDVSESNIDLIVRIGPHSSLKAPGDPQLQKSYSGSSPRYLSTLLRDSDAALVFLERQEPCTVQNARLSFGIGTIHHLISLTYCFLTDLSIHGCTQNDNCTRLGLVRTIGSAAFPGMNYSVC